jgi:hypothetical protein
MAGLRRATPSVLALAFVAACGPGDPTPSAVPVQSPRPVITTSPAPASVAPTPAETLPAGVTRLHDGPLAPGAYRFDGFAPGLQLEISEDGWEVGHFHDEFFDLFLNGDFPAIGFARFSDVQLPDGALVPATEATGVIDALRSNPNVTLDDEAAVEVDALSGRAVDLRVTAEQTPLFSGIGGAYHMDPGFTARLIVLDLPGGGAMEILVIAQGDDVGEAIEATAPMLDSLDVLD